MKKTTLLFVSVLVFSMGVFSQHSHHSDHTHDQLEHFFASRSLLDFESELGLSSSQYDNVSLLDFVDGQYQLFHQEIDERMEAGEVISDQQFEEEYELLVAEVQQELGKFPLPSPVSQSKAANGPCVNMDFETGDVTGWELTRGNVDGSMPYSYVGEFAVGPGAYHQVFGGGVDPVTGIPRVNPLGGGSSLRLGNGTGVGARAARIRQTFLVDSTNYMFTYSYAVIFQSPAGHSLNQLPYFTVRVFDSLGNDVPCGEYSVIADAANAPNYQQTNWGGSIVLYQDWQTVFANLIGYIGQNVTVEFTSGDCSLTGHFGYAYVDASCAMQDIIASQSTICTGDSSILTAPPGAANYLWSNGATTQSTTVYSGGTYSCTLIPYQGGSCSVDLEITIDEYPSPTADFTPSTVVACVGDTIEFTDLSTIPPPGVITAYRWDFGDGIITPESSGPISGVLNTTGTYTLPSHVYTTSGIFDVELWVTTADGCADSITIPVTVNALPVVVAGPDQTVCEGDLVTLSGSGALTYDWDNGVTDGVPFVATVGTIYTVIGTDINGCQNTDQVEIIVNTLPNVFAGNDTSECDGFQMILNASGAQTYVWDNGITNGSPFTQGVGTTTYTVTGTDANGCQNTDSVDVTIHALPNVDAGTDQEACLGESILFYGSGASTYTWSGGILDSVAFTPPIGNHTYVVTGTDTNGCQNTDQVDLIIWNLPIVDAGPDQQVCIGGSVTLNGAGTISYTWDNGVVDGVPFAPTTSATYTVTGTDLNGCQNTDQMDVVADTLPIVSAGSDLQVCEGVPAILNGAGAQTYVWDNNVTDGVPFIQAIGTMTYTVVGTDVNGCQNTDQVDVTVLAPPVIDAGPDQEACLGASIVFSGSGAVSYTWSGGIVDGVPFTPPIGNYSYIVTGTDANGCQNTDQVDLIIWNLPIVDAGPDQQICFGDQVTLTGSGTISYTWDNGVTDGVPFTPAMGTTYTVTGTDLNGCQNTDQVTVSVNALPNVFAGSDMEECDGSQFVLNGAGAQTYVWDNGVTNGVPFTQAIGTVTYTVVGTDANGCQNTDQVDVTVHALPLVDAGPDQQVCLGTSVVFSGSGASTYAWSGGVVDGVPFIPVAGNYTYTLTGTDANGCQNTDQVNLVVWDLPTVSAGPDQVICLGESITLSGTGAVSYVWNNGVIDGVPFTPTMGTTYTVTGTDANGCQNTDQVVVTVNLLPNVSAGNDMDVCDGSQVTLNGAGTISYTWDNGVTNGVAFTQAIGTVTYTVTGTDANGCQNTDQVDVTVHALPVVDAGPDQQVCVGTSVVFSGSGALNYAWSGGVVDGVPFTPVVGNYSYTLTGTDANGCMNTDQVNLIVWELPSVDAGPDQIICDGESVTLNGSGAQTYVWDNGVMDGVPFTPTMGTTYTVIGTDANGCQNTDQVSVTIHSLPNVSAGNDIEVCDGVQVTLNGAGAQTYVWDNGVTDGVPFTQAVGTLTYTVTGTDANGCQNTDQVDVTVHALPVVDAGPDQQVCVGTSVVFSGSGALNYAWSGGVIDGMPFTPVVGNYSYTLTGTDANGCMDTDQADLIVWELPSVDAGGDQSICDGGSVTLTGSGAVSYVWDNGVMDGVPFTPTMGTTYTVIGTDANGCQNTDQVSVTIHNLPNVSAGNDIEVCDGVQVTLNGAGAQTYVWDNGVTDGVPFTQAVGTMTYTVIGTDANGCQNTDQVDVTVHALPVVDAGPDQQVCVGTSVVFSGSGALNYGWSGGILDGVPSTPVVGNYSYTLTGTDANGCMDTDQADLIVWELPSVDAGLDQSICVGGSVTLTGSGAVSYVWDNGVVDGIPFTQPIGTMTYSVIGTDVNGCQNSDQVNVTVHDLPAVSAGNDVVVCDGDMVTLNGAGAQTYVWDNGVMNGVPFSQPVGTVTYTVIGTDANGCQNTDQVDVTVNPLPNVFAGVDRTVCEGESVTLSGSGAQTYVWDCGVIDGVPFVPPVGYTIYTVIGTDANGCQNIDQVQVNVNALPVISAGPDVDVCIGESVVLNGSGGSSYVWSGGIVDGVPFTVGLGDHTFTVTGTDINGCVNTDDVIVSVHGEPFVDAGPDQTACEGEWVTLNATGSPGIWWNFGVVDGVPFQQAVGVAHYVVYDSLSVGCMGSDTVRVEIYANPIVIAEDQEICEGEGVVLNGSGAMTYDWSHGVIDGIEFFPLESCDYTVIGTDQNGCRDTATARVEIHPIPIIDFRILNLVLTTTAPGTGFENLSQGAVDFTWNFGDGSPLNYEFEPYHEFPGDESGNYTVTLTGTSEYGCSAEREKYVYVTQDFTIFVPNTFTPDDDGSNEIFKPVLHGFDPQDYELLIFNRWGEKVFESHDMEYGWNGKLGGEFGKAVQDGVFTWKISAGLIDSTDSKVFVGHVTILK